MCFGLINDVEVWGYIHTRVVIYKHCTNFLTNIEIRNDKKRVVWWINTHGQNTACSNYGYQPGIHGSCFVDGVLVQSNITENINSRSIVWPPMAGHWGESRALIGQNYVNCLPIGQFVKLFRKEQKVGEVVNCSKKMQMFYVQLFIMKIINVGIYVIDICTEYKSSVFYHQFTSIDRKLELAHSIKQLIFATTLFCFWKL